MSNDIFSELTEVKDIDLNEILNNLIDGTNDVDLKTQILKPKQLASLKILAKFIGAIGYESSKNVLDDFLEVYFRYMFSFERQSRKEIIRAISYQMEIKAKNVMSKLTEKIP